MSTTNYNHNGHSSNPLEDAKTLLEESPPYTKVGVSSLPMPQSGENLIQPDNYHDGNNVRGNEQDEPNPDEQPDIWNYLLVGVLGTFYLASLASTIISSQMLLYLLSGGGIMIPLFGTKIPITEAVGLMGSGLLEGASLGDAYLEHKQALSGSKKWLSRGGRALAFVGQWLLYYMALGTLLFATADVNNLGTSDLETAQPEEEAVLVLTPPTWLHGVLVGTLTGAWSYASNYVGIDALFYAISRLRKRKKEESEDDLAFFLAMLAELQERLKDFEMAREMETLAQQLKQITTRMDGMGVQNDLSQVFHQGLSEMVANISDAKLKKKGISRQQLTEMMAQTLLSHPAVVPPQPFPQSSPKTHPKDWKKS